MLLLSCTMLVIAVTLRHKPPAGDRLIASPPKGDGLIATPPKTKYACVEIGSTAVKLQIIEATLYRDELPGIARNRGGPGPHNAAQERRCRWSFRCQCSEGDRAHVASFVKQATERVRCMRHYSCLRGLRQRRLQKDQGSRPKSGARGNLVEENQQLLNSVVADETYVPIDFIDSDEETGRAFQGVVPPHIARVSLYVDIGSGRTKGSSLFTSRDLRGAIRNQISYRDRKSRGA